MHRRREDFELQERTEDLCGLKRGYAVGNAANTGEGSKQGSQTKGEERVKEKTLEETSLRIFRRTEGGGSEGKHSPTKTIKTQQHGQRAGGNWKALQTQDAPKRLPRPTRHVLGPFTEAEGRGTEGPGAGGLGGGETW